MDDVLVPSGGFIPITINRYGYINSPIGRVHRETRRLHETLACCPSFMQARSQFPVGGDKCILELTCEGGGLRIWMQPEQEEELRKRLSVFRRCYGGWDVFLLRPGLGSWSGRENHAQKENPGFGGEVRA